MNTRSLIEKSIKEGAVSALDLTKDYEKLLGYANGDDDILNEIEDTIIETYDITEFSMADLTQAISLAVQGKVGGYIIADNALISLVGDINAFKSLVKKAAAINRGKQL